MVDANGELDPVPDVMEIVLETSTGQYICGGYASHIHPDIVHSRRDRNSEGKVRDRDEE